MFKGASNSAGFSNFNAKAANATAASNFSYLNPAMNLRSIDPAILDEVIDENEMIEAPDFEA
jgi:hypothetical protein